MLGCRLGEVMKNKTKAPPPAPWESRGDCLGAEDEINCYCLDDVKQQEKAAITRHASLLAESEEAFSPLRVKSQTAEGDCREPGWGWGGGWGEQKLKRHNETCR